MIVSLINQLDRLFSQPDKMIRLSPGYLYIPGLLSFAGRLNEPKTLLLVDNLSYDQDVEGLVRTIHHTLTATEAVSKWSNLSRPVIRGIMESVASGFRRGLELTEQSEANRTAALRILELLNSEQVQVRVHTHGPLPIRCGLAGADANHVSVAWLGSANPLLPNDVQQDAIVAPVDNGIAQADLFRHFDRLWNEATPASTLLADAIRNSWAALVAPPYDVYMKTLFTLVRDRLEFSPADLPGDDEITDRLADFQLAAFRQAIRVIQEYGGAFVSDVVGLGKSFVGAAVIRYFEKMEHARPLIVCPAPLVEMWETYNEAHRLNAHVISNGVLRTTGGANPLLDDVRYRDRDFVLIDESHSFRNHNTQRYRILADFMARGRRRACLLTATPRNRSVWDLYHQIKLFHVEDRTTLPIDPPNLREYFRQADAGRRELPALLGHLLVRRTRSHILRFYGRDAESGRPVDPNAFQVYRDGTRRAYIEVNGARQFFPQRRLRTVEYSIEDTYRGLYTRLRAFLTPTPEGERSLRPESLRFARYRLANYLRDESRTKTEYTHLRNVSGLHGMIRVMLFKRFESSVEAFRLTIRRMVERHRNILRGLSRGIVMTGDVLASAGDNIHEAFDELEEHYPLSDFNALRFREDLENDIEILNRMLGMIELITAEEDQKLQTLLGLLQREPLLGSRRIIFTQFADTAIYLHANLSHLSEPGAEVQVLTSDTPQKMAVVARFAPRANPGIVRFQSQESIRTLISTDILSEGLNLQDASVVVNYDLHWNPVRLIQRFGRVDRIGSENDIIHAVNFLPELGLERNLGLRQVLRQRIKEIHETIGEDSSILEATEELNEEAMYAIYEGAQGAAEGLEDDAETTGVHLSEAEELLRHLRETDPGEYARIATLPDGLRSSRPAKRSGLYTFHRSGTYSELKLIDERGNLVSDRIPQLLAMLRCSPESPHAGEFTADTARLLVDEHRAFMSRVAERLTEIRHVTPLTSGQRYAIRELRAASSECDKSEDRARLERLESICLASLPPAVNRELNRCCRECLTGKGLVQRLISIVYAYGLANRQSDEASKQRHEIGSVICSMAFKAAVY